MAGPTPYYYTSHVDELRAKGMSERDILNHIHARHPTPAVLRSGSLESQASFDTEGDVAPGKPSVKTETSTLLPDWLFDSSHKQYGNEAGETDAFEQKKPSWTFFWFKPRVDAAEA